MSEQIQRELRSYKTWLLRLPLLTRSVGILCITTYVLDRVGFGLSPLLNLDPSKVTLNSMYRLNTYPLPHLSLPHLLFNLLALAPLLERYEHEHGTLSTLLQILGPVTTFPAFLYLFVEWMLRGETSVMGASAWVFTFLANEAVGSWRVRGEFEILGKKIPTWTTPLFSMVLIAVIMPGSSFIGHACGVLIGYAMGLNYLRILLTPEWILRKIEEKVPLDAFLPHYVGLDARVKPSYRFMEQRGEDVEMQHAEGERREESAFQGRGRTLGT